MTATSEPHEQLLACIPRLRRYARALVGDRAGADDLVQDTLERGWARLRSWQSGSDMRAWLFSIMHNVRIDQIRRPSVPTQLLNEDTLMPIAPGSPSSGLELRDMASALRGLPDEQREILLLVALEEMSYDDVAQTLKIPIGTVMSRLSRAREKMRANMEGRTYVAPLKVVK
ncbi:RNA polymerase sigma factor [Massilia sp. P8910]|uniref:RNA polymerase sigma factor n=1 Tax=Massilia antarctica TaxID=2765360 RepID=UPI0006BB6395|nr:MULTISPECIES: RNA polymerase sigma factor [Massilia]MCE3602466.1 RNA polymerase sigma factor [Massilia antarctica]MCY0914607.1 RNA polymerase sigma factor [Massilia sp. H27-R4]